MAEDKVASRDLERFARDIKEILLPLQQGEFEELLGRVSVYLDSVVKNWRVYHATIELLKPGMDENPEKFRHTVAEKINVYQASVKNSLRFARINLDAAMTHALESLVWRPRNTNKKDEQRKAEALKKSFDGSSKPAKIMLDLYSSTSDPQVKFLILGPWGHEYLKKRNQDLEIFDRALCEKLGSSDSPASIVVLNYSRLCLAFDELEKEALKTEN